MEECTVFTKSGLLPSVCLEFQKAEPAVRACLVNTSHKKTESLFESVCCRLFEEHDCRRLAAV
jgi:hypothetical protein